ncbi:LacI family DNA-binding transcriptional regulator [Paenibacillus woosongensis]|uniref:LacI family DNA-binding transcriptional regulator n=1 Tax=Paenibacillus woosongensis TaxID=307580 RepID=A0A7X2Z588_9BACL|nr:LacI family DNA-binding transcriptional regulator [Paenibacillus woosongensis]MUG47769.1 LacI family DNA-binding transcriptional regulator [Paenibacillus woosongensis]
MRKNEINSIEIARIAGVSRSTVSRVINNYPNVPQATRDKVMQVIEQYKYSPNFSARIMSGMKTRTIGLFLISPEEVFHDSLTNSLITGFIESASNQGYYVLTHIIRNTRDSEVLRKVKETFYQQRIDGGVFIGAANHEPLIEELIAEGYVVGIIDQHIEGRNEPNRVICNFGNDQGMKQGVDYLASLNHRRIGFIAGDPLRCSGPEKLEGFKAAMRSHGLEVNPEWIIPADFSEKSGYNSVKQWLGHVKELPTAIFACNDSVAFGALAAIQEAGLSVPEDISLMGFDDHLLSSRIQPALTSIHVDFAEMVDTLASRLIKTIEDPDKEFKKYVGKTGLVIRESCRAI